MLSNNPVGQTFNAKLIHAVKESLNSEYIEFKKCHLVKSLLEVFLRMESEDKYRAFFLDNFIQTLAVHYQTKSVAEYRLSGTIIDKITSLFKKEQTKYAELLPKESLPSLDNVLFKEYVQRNIDVVIDDRQSGLLSLVRDDNYKDIKEMHDIFSKGDGGSKILSARLKGVVITLGKELLTQPLTPEKYISSLIELVKKLNPIVKEGFGQNCDFESAVNEGFESFMRDFKDSSAFFVKYINDLLVREATSIASKEEFKEKVNALRTVFFHVHNKDEFEFLYRRHMITRLLSPKGFSGEYERMVLDMFAKECGSLYVYKLETMFKDLDRSNDFNTEFKEECRTKGIALPFDFNFLVLTTRTWIFKSNELKLPNVVVDTRRMFEEFYLRDRYRQKLTWYDNMSTAEVQVTISPESSYLITLNASQFAVMYNIFCADSVPTLKHVVESTGLPFDEVKRLLFNFNRIRLIVTKSVSNGSSLAIKSPEDFGTMEKAGEIKFDLCKKFKYKSKMLNLSSMKDISSGSGGGAKGNANKKRLPDGSGNGDQEGSNEKHVKDDKVVLNTRSVIVRTLKSWKEGDEGNTFAKLNEVITKDVPGANAEITKLCLKQLIAKGFIKKNGDTFEYCKEDETKKGNNILIKDNNLN